MMIPTGHLTSGPAELDEIDLKILRELQGDARLSIREVAARVNLSPSPTQERIRRLEKERVILQYGALLNHKKVNKGVIVLCQVTIREHNPEAAQAFIAAIQQLPEVTDCYNTAGDFDFTMKIMAASIEAYHDFFVNRLSRVPYIGQAKSTFVMDVIKNTHVIL